MAERSPLYQQAIGKGGLVIGATVSELPLLPYEKQLIKTIGCSEEEYRYFVAEAIKRGQIRPAEYEGIPDINNGAATPYLIQLAIGIVIGAVSYLLTPKPKAPEAFEIERRLVEELDIPVMHDDQHGTAIISGAALINALELAAKKIGDVKICLLYTSPSPRDKRQSRMPSSA